MGKSCCYFPGTMCKCKHSPKPSFDGHRPPAHSHRPPNNFPNASKNRATPNGARCTSLLAQTSSHGPKTIKCLSMVLYCRELLLHSRGVEAFSRQGGPMWPWLHELEGMRRHLSKVDPNGPTVVPSCKGDAIQLISTTCPIHMHHLKIPTSPKLVQSLLGVMEGPQNIPGATPHISSIFVKKVLYGF